MRESANRRRQTSICSKLRIPPNPKSRNSKYGRRQGSATISTREWPQNDPDVRQGTSDVERKGNEVRPRGWRKRRQLRAVNRMIEGIPFNRDAAGGADQAFELVARRKLGRFRAGVVVNLFFHNGSVEVVRAEAQRNLRDARREHDPIRLDVLEIVEYQPRRGDVAQIGVTGRLRNERERGVVRMKSKRDKRHKAMRLVLQLAQLDEVIDALFFRFHVPVEHRRVGTQPDFMRLPRNIEPHLPADFVIADNPAHARMKNFRASAG